MKKRTEIFIDYLKGHKKGIRDYARLIALQDPSNCNGYMIAIGEDNEPLWCVQAGEENEAITWDGVKRVEIYKHSVDGECKYEYVYVSSQKALNEYMAEWKQLEKFEAKYRVKKNKTKYNI